MQYSPYPLRRAARPAGFREYQDGIDYLAVKYPRFVKVTKLSDVYGPAAVSVGRDGKRPGEAGDTAASRSR